MADCLEEDLTLCQDVDTNLLCWLVPGVFEQYVATACDNPALIHVIISTVDSAQLQQLITSILLGKSSATSLLSCQFSAGFLPVAYNEHFVGSFYGHQWKLETKFERKIDKMIFSARFGRFVFVVIFPDFS